MRVLTTGEAAKLLDLDPNTVRHLERTKQLPALRTPTGRRVFRRRDVERLVAARQRRKTRRSARAIR